jgi:hypothetical protein
VFCPTDINAILVCPLCGVGLFMQINLYFYASIEDIMRIRLRWSFERFLETLTTLLLRNICWSLFLNT